MPLCSPALARATTWSLVELAQPGRPAPQQQGPGRPAGLQPGSIGLSLVGAAAGVSRLAGKAVVGRRSQQVGVRGLRAVSAVGQELGAGPGVTAQGPAEAAQVDNNNNNTNVDSLKRQLLRLCAAGSRGLGGEKERRQMLELVQQLEQSFRTTTTATTTAGPVQTAADQQSQVLEGSWAVIFTTSPDLTSLERLPLPGWRTGRIGQVFAQAGEALNEIDFWSPFGTKVSQTVQCKWAVKKSEETFFAVELTFVGSSTKLSEVAGMEMPVPPLSLPLPPAAGVFRVTFVDDELLVQRTGGRAGVNVLVRETSGA
ncbi:unnamed protein product [Polarella glacialis]|uniref:Plastid lipid-associated protein/fibrillin conserved domain-containing protein n=1 Tax=Polarella glacialis TaxID=89957 RepID=A0A813K3T7_POLGL|nr:unnamed protein product [Polarella glacialis]